MLRLYGYSRTRCYAFDPPGQLLTLEAAKYFDTFTISIVTGDDMICRLSQNSLQILKMDIARLLSECDLPKYKIFGGALSTLCFGSKAAKRPRLPTINRRSIAERVDDQRKKSISLASQKEFEYRASSRFSWVLKPFSPILRNEIQKKVKGFVKAIDPTAPHEHDVHDKECMEQSKGLPFPQMYIPGRILYIEKCRLWGDEEDIDLPWTTSRYSMMTDSSSHSSSSSSSSKGSSTPKKKKGKAKYSYAPRWASREEFQEIIVSRTLLSDHFPFPLLEELNNTSPGRKLRASRMN